MHKIFTVLFFVTLFKISAQTTAPKLINYQGIARDALGFPITSPFNIQFIIKDASLIVHNEIQTNISPSALGLFSTKIGLAPNTLTLTSWDTGPFVLEVWLKTGSTYTQVGTQQLVSVPFSLFAGNVPTSYTNNVLTIGASSYSISSGSAVTPTINGNGLATVTPSTGPVYNVNVPTPTLSYLSAGNILTLNQGSYSTSVPLTGAGSSTINIVGTGVASVSPTSGSAFTVNVPNPSLNFSGNTLIYSQGTFVTSSLFNAALTGDVIGPISSTTVSAIRNVPVAAITPTNNQVLTYSSSSWIPTTPPLTTLTQSNGIVVAGSAPNYTISAANSGANAVWATLGNSGTTSTLNFVGTTDAKDLNIRTNNVTRLTVQSGGNVGIGTVSPNGKLDVLENSVSAPAITGKNTSAASSSLATGVYGETNNLDVNNAAVFGLNTGNGHGVLGKTNSVSSGVSAENTGSGPALRALKQGSSTGNAARLEILNPTNSADAVFARTEGVGAAVHAVTSTTNSTSALSLLIENGHVASTGASPTTTMITSLTAGGGITLLSTSTDVAGRITIIFGTGPFTTGTYAGINFNKFYVIAPIVILTPTSASASTANVYVNASTSGFTITHNSAPGAGTTHSFNYLVIETK